MLSKLTRGNQITIPKSIVDKVGLKSGADYLDVEYEDGVICLVPVDIEERIPKEILKRVAQKALKEENGDITLTAKEAEHFLEKRAKKESK